MNKTDLRYIKTEELIKKTFKSLVFDVGFDKTFVQDICTKARISRNTFYAHYIDKYHLVESLFNEFKNYTSSSFKDKYNFELSQNYITNAVWWYVDCIERNHETVKLLLKCSESNFLNMMKQTIVIEPTSRMIENFEDLVKKDYQLQLVIEYMFSGMIGFTKRWLDNREAFNREYIIEELEKLSVNPVKLFYEKINKHLNK